MFRKSHSIVTAAVCGLLSGGLLTYAQQTPAPEPARTAQPDAQGGQQNDKQVVQQIQQLQQSPDTAQDKLFLLNAAMASNWEVQLSQQAQQKAQTQSVKDLAQHVLQDHQQMNEQLQQTAKQMGLTVPQGLGEIKQQELQIIASLTGKDFEQHYVADMNACHARDVSIFQTEAQIGKTPQVKQFAQQTLPKLQQHQQMAMQASAALGLPTPGAEAVPAGSRIRGSETPGGTGEKPERPETPGGTGTGTGGTGGVSR